MDEVKAFYSSDISVDTLKNEKYDDGSEVLVVAFSTPTQIVQLMFWSGRTEEGASEETDWGVKDFEDYLRSVHDDIIVSNVCGFDQYMDNHYAYDGNMDE